MKLVVNQESLEFPEASTLEEILKQLNLTSSRGVAVAINDEVIPRSTWASVTPKDQDRLAVLRASQGG